MAIGERIRRARIAAVLEQKELAERTGLSAQTIWAVENGRRNPSPPTIRKIADALGIDPTELVGE